MTIEERQKVETQRRAMDAAAQAAIRADSGEYIFATRDEVSLFVNALPPDVRVRWQVEPVVGFGHQYRVTFWRSFWRGGGRKTSEPTEQREETSKL